MEEYYLLALEVVEMAVAVLLQVEAEVSERRPAAGFVEARVGYPALPIGRRIGRFYCRVL